jgi:hypothetical protein
MRAFSWVDLYHFLDKLHGPQQSVLRCLACLQ